ncbi:MAG: polyprenyl synthetase family protein [Chloroflexota bacterium]
MSAETKSPAPSLPGFFSRYQDRIDTALRDEIAGLDPQIYAIHRYYMGWEETDGTPVDAPAGKRMRPTLALLAADAVNGDLDKATPIATALEYVHNFSLIHDDLEDMDRVRHHRLTVWAVWGEPAAIVSGNAMLKVADFAASKLRQQGVSDRIALLAESALTSHYLKMMEGQYLDISFENLGAVSVDDYLDMIERKTGALIEASVYLGALVAGGSDTTEQEAIELKKIGYELGRIFQIRDDVLGVWGGQETGKPVGADIKRKKKALPAVHAISSATGASAERISEIFGVDGELSGEQVEDVLNIMDELGTQDYCQSIAEQRWQECQRLIDSADMPPHSANEFLELGEFLLVRQS